MELIIDVLLLFILLNCLFKLSLWHWWQRLAFSAVLGWFAWWSVRYAILQSKTQIADFLANTEALQTMAILVTIESAIGLAFCLRWLNEFTVYGKLSTVNKAFLWFYPSLLIFPVVFYLLTQTIFSLTGVPFETTGLAFGIGTVLLLPLLSEAVRWLLPDEGSRVELHLLLTIFVCLLGLIATEHGKMVYAMKESPVDWHQLLLTFSLFLLLGAAGFVFSRLKWRFKKSSKSSKSLFKK